MTPPKRPGTARYNAPRSLSRSDQGQRKDRHALRPRRRPSVERFLRTEQQGRLHGGWDGQSDQGREAFEGTLARTREQVFDSLNRSRASEASAQCCPVGGTSFSTRFLVM